MIFSFNSIADMILYQYFIEVVPTKVKTFLTSVDTYQYSVKELSRPIDHDKGSHGMPGIFFKYDVSALKVNISQERDNLGMFLARLCAVVGGIYVCSGIQYFQMGITKKSLTYFSRFPQQSPSVFNKFVPVPMGRLE